MGNVIRFPKRRAPLVEARRPPEPLWREVVGEQLRDERRDRDQRLVDVAARAGVSPQYLSELERGRKDPSSEVLAAVTGALGLTMHDLSERVTRRFGQAPSAPMCLAA